MEDVNGNDRILALGLQRERLVKILMEQLRPPQVSPSFSVSRAIIYSEMSKPV